MLKYDRPNMIGKRGVTYASIRTCSLSEGKSVADLPANDSIWNKYLDDYGFEGGVWRWWPETGSATTFTHDYWNVASFRSVEEYGAGRMQGFKQ